MRKEISEKIKSSNEIQIDLNNMDISENEIEAIANEIKKIHPQVQRVLLNNNKIDDKAAILIGKHFNKISGLTFIDLQFNTITLSGAEALFILKKTFPNLKIALHGNKISDVAKMSKIEKV